MPQLKLALDFEAIGTRWFIELAEAPSAALQQAIIDRIESFDAAYSRFRSDTLVTRMAHEAGTFRLPDDAAPMIKLYHRLYELTNGAMTPLIGQVLSDAGYDADYSLKPKHLTTPPSWDEVMAYKSPNITLQQPALLDFGAMGKGYLVDIVSEIIASYGYKNYLVNAGGDLFYVGDEAIEIGLEDPSEIGTMIGSLKLESGQALCGSAGNRRAWAGYHHIIDPRTLESPRELKAVWVVASNAMLADALTTALSFTEAKKLAAEFDFEYAMVAADGSFFCSAPETVTI